MDVAAGISKLSWAFWSKKRKKKEKKCWLALRDRPNICESIYSHYFILFIYFQEKGKKSTVKCCENEPNLMFVVREMHQFPVCCIAWTIVRSRLKPAKVLMAYRSALICCTAHVKDGGPIRNWVLPWLSQEMWSKSDV